MFRGARIERLVFVVVREDHSMKMMVMNSIISNITMASTYVLGSGRFCN